MTTLSERNALVRLLDCLDAADTALKRDISGGYGRKGDLAIEGRHGQIYASGDRLLLFFSVPEKGNQTPSSRPWERVKRTLSFCKVTQDGDWEGCLQLDRLPTAAEGEAIRVALGIRKRWSGDRTNSKIIGRPFVKSPAPLPTSLGEAA
jgi:hypothetical protein